MNLDTRPLPPPRLLERESSDGEAHQYQPAQLDLRDLFTELARRWRLLALSAVVFGCIGLVLMARFQPQYVATMTVLPESGQGLLSTRTHQAPALSGIAGFFGSNFFGAKDTTIFDRVRLTVGSVKLAEVLEEELGLTRRIFASQWDSESNRWRRPTGLTAKLRDQFNSIFNLHTWSEPDTERLAQYLKRAVKFEKMNKDEEFWEVRVEHPSREIAELLLRTVYFRADDLVREQDRVRVAERKSYLEKRLQEASISELRTGLVGTLLGEEQRMMLLSADLPYAGRIVAGPHVSSQKTQPSLLLYLFVPVLLGLSITIFTIVLRKSFWAESP